MRFEQEYENLKEVDDRVLDIHRICMYQDEKIDAAEPLHVGCHWHEWVEILNVCEGEITVHANESTFHVGKGQCIVIGSLSLHAIDCPTGYRHVQCLHIPAGYLLEHHCLDYLEKQTFMIKNMPAFLENLTIIAASMYQTEVTASLDYEIHLLKLVTLLVEENKKGRIIESKIAYGSTFQQILSYIHVNYHEDLTLNGIAKHFGYSPQHVALLFRTYLKQTFLGYLNELRVNKAKYMLSRTDERIIDIAFGCGYPNEHALIRNFKKITGYTPLAYRKEAKKIKS